jgi:hypothetical protein
VYDAQIDIGEAGDIARRARRARHKALHNGLIHLTNTTGILGALEGLKI